MAYTAVKYPKHLSIRMWSHFLSTKVLKVGGIKLNILKFDFCNSISKQFVSYQRNLFTLFSIAHFFFQTKSIFVFNCLSIEIWLCMFLVKFCIFCLINLLCSYLCNKQAYIYLFQCTFQFLCLPHNFKLYNFKLAMQYADIEHLFSDSVNQILKILLDND